MNQEQDNILLRKRLEAAHGYLMLGMEQDARRELDGLDEHRMQDSTEKQVLTSLRLELALLGSQWREGEASARHMREWAPDEPQGFIHGAYCLHELGRTHEAVQLLLAGPQALRKMPLFFYNLACYHAVLGQRVQALASLNEAFQRDPGLRDVARTDPDLKGLNWK